MARFQGDVHTGSDRLAATILVLVLLIALGLLFWYILDPAGFNVATHNLENIFGARR